MKISTQEDFKLPPEGLLLGTVKEILDEGVQPDPFKPGKNRHQVKIVWSLNLPDGTTVEQWDWLTFSLHPKATLYKAVKALRGGIPPKGEYELSDFVGGKAMVQTEHHLSKTGQNRSKIAAYYPAPNGHGVATTDNDLPENLR